MSKAIDKSFKSRIKRHVATRRVASQGWDRLARLYSSKVISEEGDAMAYSELGDECATVEGIDGTTAEFNLLYTALDTSMSSILPPRPSCSFKARNSEERKSRKLLSYVVTEMMHEARLGAKLRKSYLHASLFRTGILKVTWDTEDNERPLLKAVNPRCMFWDTYADCMEDIRYIIEAIPTTKEEFRQQVGRDGPYKLKGIKFDEVDFGEYPHEFKGVDISNDFENEAKNTESDEWVTVYQVYDLVHKKLRVYYDGQDEPLYLGNLPFQYMKHPFVLFQTNDDPNTLAGLSDGELAYSSLQRGNELEEIRMTTVKIAAAAPLTANTAVMNDPDEFLEEFNNASVTPGVSVVPVELTQGHTIGDALSYAPIRQVTSSLTATLNDSHNKTNMVLASPAFGRGQAGSSDVATEISAQGEGVKTRNAARQEIVYNAIEEVALKIVALMAEYLPLDYVDLVEINGKDELVSPESLRLGGVDPNVEGAKAQYTPPGFRMSKLRVSASPYNQENQNAITRLRALNTLAPLLLQNPMIDQQKLLVAMTEDLGYSDMVLDQPPAPQAPPGLPPQGGGLPPNNAGALPPEPGPMQGGAVESAAAPVVDPGAEGMGVNF